jgi:hypothetical protein
MGAPFPQDLHGRAIPSGFTWAPHSLRICMGASFPQDLHGRLIPSGFAWAPHSLRIYMGASLHGRLMGRIILFPSLCAAAGHGASLRASHFLVCPEVGRHTEE